MPDLPKPGSEWIRRSDDKPSLWNVVHVDGESVHFQHQDCGCSACDALPIADFHRDFIENGPVTLERLEACGWDVEGDTASYRLPFHDENHSDRLGWNESDGAFLEIGHGDRFLPGCTSMLGVLWAMRLFVTP